MPVTYSPLRYPGGKTQLAEFVMNLIKINNIANPVYVEPFSGGAGISIKLLLKNKVDRIIINDFDPSIHAVWHAILNQTDELIEMIEKEEVTIENWKNKREVLIKVKEEPFSLENGFCTLFMNRTNISGIINGGPIGGVSQNSKYKIDCRYNKKGLIDKIIAIAEKKKDIQLYNLDVNDLIDFLVKKESNKNLFTFFDPPYYKQGKNLYTNFFELEDHINLYKNLQKMNDFYWITTYDYEQVIADLYSNELSYEYELRYSANSKRKARELLFANKITNVESYKKVILSKCCL